ncbi:MAG: FAD-dependent oxidoreductase, partial [Acidimicrobiia bacterium]|nr:FAD-dependent oxidoreductase [Acidimicrobiia bacterium]MDX2466288.1 FAD-dependent oxidoreductase [Acidimicrobiia bacterium]
MAQKVVIIGGGFAGLTTAQRLKRADVEITLIDRTNHHLFQPLLYQVATGGLSPADIATPIRYILRRQKNVRVIEDTVIAI